MHGFDNLPCLDVKVSSQGLNGTVEYGNYGDFSIQSNNSESACDPWLIYSVFCQLLCQHFVRRNSIHGL